MIEARAVLFDNDDVLSERCEPTYPWQALAAKLGITAKAAHEKSRGQILQDTVRQLYLACFGQEPSPRCIDDHVGDLKQREIDAVSIYGARAMAGALDLLATLAATRTEWAIVTSANRDLLRLIIEKSGLPEPHERVCGKEARRGKPHPDPFLRAAELLGKDPGDCVVFEDAVVGVQAGVAAGMKVIGVSTTTTPKALQDAGATFCVKTLAGVSVTPLTEGRIYLVPAPSSAISRT